MSEALYDEAMRLLSEGRGEEADEYVAEALKEVSHANEPEGRAWGEVAFQAAQYMVSRQRLTEARELLERATQVEWGQGEGEAQRLMVLLNLGELCLFMADLDAAEEHLVATVAGRREHFGMDHPAFAFGLEAFADFLLAKREPHAARAEVLEAERVLRAHDHPRLAGTLVLRAHIEKAAGGLKARGFQTLEDISDERLDELAMETIVRSEASHPDLSYAVLDELRRHVVRTRGESDSLLGHLIGAMIRAADASSDTPARIQSLRYLIRHFEASGDASQQVDALQALAIAQNDAGRHDAADETYAHLVEKAQETGKARLASALRAQGLFLSSMNRKEEAEVPLTEAVRAARESEDGVELGRALVALGILKHQRGGSKVARPFLEEGLAALPDDHGDCLFAQRHLAAIAAGENLDAKPVDAVSQTLLAMLQDRIPGDLVNDVRVGVDDRGQLDLQLDLSREPQPEEAQTLEVEVERALAALSAKLHQTMEG